jgi:glucosamine--fructose-6-phosphate aminotransferase (isomerizing)
MHDAIYAQPGALRLLTRANGAALGAAADRVQRAARVVVTGVGSSWHAARVGELLLAGVGGLGWRARAIHAFALARYWPALDAGDALIAVSHRGTTRDTVAALGAARAAGAATIAVVGKDAAVAADVTLRTVDQESSETHTVGYTAALALLAALAVAVGGDDATGHALDSVPDLLALLLGQESWEDIAARYGERRRYYFVGGGPNAATADEAALKMHEASYVAAHGFDAEEFLHGPWTALTAEDALFVVAPPGAARERALTAARVARAIGAPVIALAAEDDREMADVAGDVVALPPVPEALSPLVAVVPLQLFAYHTALRAGANPDATRAESPAHARARGLLAR